MGCLAVLFVLFFVFMIDWFIIAAAVWLITLFTDLVFSVGFVTVAAIIVFVLQILFNK